MSANIEVKDIPAKVLPLLSSMTKYLGVVIVILFVLIYSFLLLRINSLSSYEPSDDEVIEKLEAVKRPRIDEDAALKMERLEDQNIQVQSLFNEARKNPFAE